MYHYLVNALKGKSGKADGLVARSDPAITDSKAGRNARLREEEQAQRVLRDRRRAYSDFMTRTPLGRVLADQMPAVESMSTAPATAFAVCQTSSSLDTRATGTSVSLATGGERPSPTETGLAHTKLELTMYEALAPLLSRRTAIMTRRVLELAPQLAPAAPEAARGEQASTTFTLPPPFPCQRPFVTLEEAKEALLPFLLVLVQLRHWQACLASLSATLSSEAAARSESATTASDRLVKALQQLSHVLVAITCATELQTATMRSHLDLLGGEVTACVATTLQFLRRLTRSCGTEEFSLLLGRVPAASASAAESIPQESEDAIGGGDRRDGTSTPHPVSVEVVEIQACRLLSLFLYWLHVVHDISTPSLAIEELFLTSSTARFNAYAATVATAKGATAGTAEAEAEEMHRCTGLSNAALLRQTGPAPSCVPLAMLSLSASDASGGSGGDKSPSEGSSPLLASSSNVAGSLTALLLFASKGVVEHAQANSEAHTVMVEGLAVEEDSDLGLILVLTSRLLRYMFAAGASPHLVQVTKAAGPLQSALSLLLVRFIAGDRNPSALRAVAEKTEASQSASLRSCGAQPHLDAAADFSFPRRSSLASTSQPPSPARSRCSSRASVPSEQSGRLTRQLRLLGQLSCGLVLLTTLLQQNAMIVLDIMDHSFFFDALVTVLQVVGSRFTEPSRQGAMAARVLDAAGRRDSDAWADWVRGVETVAAQGTAAEDISVLLNHALGCPLQFSLTLLSSDPYVDEFLHAYLGLLAACRVVRSTPLAFIAPPPRGMLLGSNGAITASARESRALDTLDQLELTLLKTFLTAYDTSTEDAAPAAAAAAMELSITLPPCPEQHSVDSEATDALPPSGDMNATGSLTFPLASCIYNLLLKHTLWCLGEQERRRGQPLPPPPPPLTPPQAPVPPQQHHLALPLLQSSVSSAVLRLSIDNPASTATDTPRLVAQPPPTHPPVSPTLSPSTITPANLQQSAATTLPGHSSLAAITGTGSSDYDPFVLFLVRHGLFRILLHDEHFASAFALAESTAAVNAADSPRGRSCDEEAADKPTTTRQRSYLVLYLLSHFLQLRPCDAGSSDGEQIAQPAGAQEGGGASADPNVSCRSACSRSSSNAALSADEQQLAQETAEALMTVLRVSSVSVSPPCCAVVRCRRRRWCNCLLALLSAATAAPGAAAFAPIHVREELRAGIEIDAPSAADAKTTPAAAAAVCEALVRAGGAEYLLRAAAVAADAGAAGQPANTVSCAWAMQAARSLVKNSTASVHISTNCVESLLLPLLWHPSLRSDGQRLLETLLCQPLVGSGMAVDTNVDMRELSSSMVSSTGKVGSDSAAADMHAVPRHCRKLCEGVWRTLCECANGSAVGGSGVEMPDAITSGTRAVSTTNADKGGRQAVLRAVLGALGTAFRKLSGQRFSDAGEHSGELLPLRTLQRALFEASKDDGQHIYEFLLHELAQLWKAVDNPGTSSRPPPLNTADVAEVALSPPFPVPFLIAASDAPSAPDTSPAEATEASADAVATCRAGREMVRLIVIALVGMTLANPSQREVLYRATVDEEALVRCIVNAWGTTGGSGALPFSRSMSEGDACGMVRVCSYLIYESVDAVDAFFDEDGESGSQDTAPRRRGCSHDASWAWSLQNTMLLAAVLRCFTRLGSLTDDQQAALRKLLVSLTRTVESCYVSLYLAASSVVHDVLAQLLPVVALLPKPATLRFSSSAETEAALPRLDVVLVRLLAVLTHCHVDARQLKQLLLLVIHSRHQRDRRALVPLVLQVLSEAVQPPLNMTLLHAARRDPQHFVSLHRGRGPAGFCAALPDFPLEGYSASLNVRWEGDVTSRNAAGQAAGGDTTLRQYDDCACIFSLRTADRATLLAFMVERRTGRLFVQYRNLQQQELRVYLAASLLPREWTHLCVSHRAAAFLTATAGGQLTLFVNGAEAAVIPQVTYPLMSRGYLYVGCLGHEVDRLSVAHAFYGQVSTAYFFPYVLPEREREVLQTTVGVADTAAWMLSSSTATIPPLRPGSFAPGRRPGSSASESAADADGAEQWLAGRAVVCVDTRLSDRGHLYNLSAVLRGRTGRESRLLTLEGSLVCSTQRLIDSMGALGALPSVLMPLCVLLVNPNLPISSRSLAAAAPIGSLAHREPGLPPFSSLGAAAVSASRASDTINASVLRVLDLVPPLASAEAIRTEIAEARFFVFLGQVLQLLGPSLQVVVPAAFVQLLEALAPFPRLFEDALTNLFLSADVIRAAPRAVQLTWVKVQRFFLSAHPDALPCLRTLGTSMFVAAELLRVTAEEASEEELAQEDTLVLPQTQDVVTHPLLSPTSSTSRPLSAVAGDVSRASSSATTSPFLPSSTPPPPPPSCSLQDLENQWMAYFEALAVAPVTLGDAEALQYFVGNLHLMCPKASVQLRLLRRVRQLLVTSNTPYLVQLLGRRNYVVNLMPYLTSASSEAVRLEALLQLLFMVFRSKRTQELMNPVLLASKDTVVHVVEEVSLSWLKDVLQRFPVNLPVYLALRCGLVERFDVLALPTQYVPLDESHAIRFAAVLLPLLMLMKRSTDTKLKGYVLTDMAVLLKSDAQAWRRVITVRGWYVSVVGLFASSCASSPVPAPSSLQEARACQESSVPGAVSSPTIPTDSAARERVQTEGSGLAFATISMILSYTIYQVLLHETYGATELELVVAYLREQRLHRLLHQVLCRVADRYRSRLMAPWRGERRGGTGDREGPGAPRPSNGCAFLGLGSATAVVNLCHFLRVVEVVLFYAGLAPRRKEAIMAPVKPAVSPFTPAGAASGGEEFGTHLPVRVGYSEWEQLTLVRSADDPPGGVAESDVYYAGEVDDPHGNVRRAVLRSPDDRWLHLPLAVKCAELLCSHSALLHLGSNGNTTSLSVGGAGSVVGSGSAGTGGPGDLLWSVVLGASAGTGVSSSPTSPKAGGVGGVGLGAGGGGATPVVLRGGMLRLFGRLFKVLCQMTLRSGTALSSVVELTDAFVHRVDRGQRGSGFLLLKRAVNAEDAREHSPIAITMTLIYCVHNLLLRRLHAAEYGNTSTHFNANAALVDRLKSLVVMFRYSFEQLSAFASSPRGRRGAHSSVFRQPSLLAAASWLTRGDREDSGGDRSSGRNSTASRARSNSTYLDDLTGETLTAGVPTLQWLCDHRANPRRTVEAFAEVASRVDYNAFAERCLLAVEREQSTDKALAAKLWSEQRASLRRLQELFAENSMSRRLVHDKIQTLMAAFNSQKTTGAAGETDSDAGAAGLEGHSSTRTDGFATASFTGLFLPCAARRATAAARANAWTRFTVALRGTVWCADAAGLHNTLKYVKLSSQEQQFLVHRKLVYDRDGTNYCGRAMTSYSAPSSPVCDDLSSVNVTSFRAMPALLEDEGESGGGLAFGGSMSANTSRASYLRLRGGEGVLLQAIDDDDAGLEEDMMNFSLDGRGDVSTAAAASFSECPLLREEAAPVSKGIGPAPTSKVDDFSAVPSLLSVPCEVPYMMHCWSGSFTVRGSEVIVLIDDDNKAYNQVVAEEARAYVLRPRPFSFHLSHITQIAPARRFRMRRTALEIWTRDRRSCFVDFADTATMNAALQAVRCGERSSYMLTAPSFLRDAAGAATAALPTLLHEGTGGVRWHSAYVLQENPRREPMRLRATALWRNRLLSNFDYLLVLNLLAGRTLNDMTQYPVFPWILSDYTSETLDLTNPETFRDLSMPMGACGNRDRRELVRQRYMEMRSLGDVPSHYFTHYSSPAITLYFLVRLPPFTTLAILLQGGHFDHADRMFHSMQATFRAVMTSTQDVRELIPELYYLPELCINENHVDFGRRQDRTSMDDLQLPPWAHNDPFTFVYRMREALESAHVSAHLHKWIDLIFGYKQRGKDAIDALNVFNWHSYEELDRNREAGSIDQQLLVDSLDNIGQTPVQLFRRPHQPRLPLEWADPLQLPIRVKVMTLRWGCARVARTTVLSTDRVLVVAGSGAAASLRMHLTPIRQPSVLQIAAATPPAASTAAASQLRRASARDGVAASAPSQTEMTATHASSHVNAPAAAVPGHPATPVAVTPVMNHHAPPAMDSGSFDVSEEYERHLAPIPAGVIPNNSAYADGSCTEASTALLCYDSEVFLVLGGLFDNSVVIRALSGAGGDARLRAHRGRVVFVAGSEDSRYLVTGAEDTTFAVWSCQLQPARQRLEVTMLFTIYSHEGMPSAVDVSSTLDVVATASLNGTLMLHSLSTGGLDRVIRHPYGAPIHRVLLQTTCYVPNIVFLSHQDEKVYQYSLNGAALRTFSPPGRVATWATTASQCLLLACQPLASVRGGSSASAPGGGPQDGDQTSCILYLHSFFLEVLKTVPVRAEDVVSSVSAHPTNPQVVVAGTESGQLLLLRSVLV
ncbi:neurobeachin/beige protein [Leishmania donovani]|uniref:Neurobeachin/beige_protein_putative/GeneDB:LmjF.3 6.1720 n=1 Tax=Leishmania donovani TaxID=5661 RepID=A0A6J8FRV0_LEIDO|nr:neurobeachin/beige protein [Leishmania donovani]VDZ49366.1 neurobeachin/beige_protein_putative/GeneDB:LmjF.36.1720 [Leishmania donovani]